MRADRVTVNDCLLVDLNAWRGQYRCVDALPATHEVCRLISRPRALARAHNHYRALDPQHARPGYERPATVGADVQGRLEAVGRAGRARDRSDARQPGIRPIGSVEARRTDVIRNRGRRIVRGGPGV